MLLREVQELKNPSLVFRDFWFGNGGPNPPRALWDSSILTVIFRVHVVLFFFIYVHGRDLIFPEFGLVPSDDSLGICS